MVGLPKGRFGGGRLPKEALLGKFSYERKLCWSKAFDFEGREKRQGFHVGNKRSWEVLKESFAEAKLSILRARKKQGGGGKNTSWREECVVVRRMRRGGLPKGRFGWEGFDVGRLAHVGNVLIKALLLKGFVLVGFAKAKLGQR